MADDIPPIDIPALDRYLCSDRAPDNCMGLSDLDGFLTAIVIGPEPIPPSEWLPVIWDDEAPEFESETEAQTILTTIMGRYNQIAACFASNPRDFDPIFWQGPGGEVVVADWAAGFLDAVAMRRIAWEPLFNHPRAKVLMEPLLILGDDGDFDDERDADDRWKEFYASKPNVIPTCVLAVDDFWKDYRDRQKPQPRRGRRPRR
jgi:uncharacterized protein